MKRTDYISQLTLAEQSEAAALADYRAAILATQTARSQTVDAPPAVTGLSASIDESGALGASWNPEEDAASYRCYRRPVGSVGSSEEEAIPVGTTARFDGPFATAQEVWVESVNEGGNAFSAMVQAEPPAP